MNAESPQASRKLHRTFLLGFTVLIIGGGYSWYHSQNTLKKERLKEAEQERSLHSQHLLRHAENSQQLLQLPIQETLPSALPLIADCPIEQQTTLNNHLHTVHPSPNQCDNTSTHLSQQQLIQQTRTKKIRDYIVQHYLSPMVSIGKQEKLFKLLGWRPFFYKALKFKIQQKQKKDAILQLQKQNISADEYNKALHSAVRRRDLSLMTLLLHAGADVNAKDDDHYSPLCNAATMGELECLSALLSHPDIDVNAADDTGKTPLYLALRKQHTECVKQLLSHPNIDVNKADKNHRSPLLIASMYGNAELINLLLNHPKIQTADWEPLHLAILRNDIATIQDMINADANAASVQGKEKIPPLMLAAATNKPAIIKILLSCNDIDVNEVIWWSDHVGFGIITSLDWAARNGNTECVKLLLSCSNIEIRSNQNPLQLAAYGGHAECVKALLSCSSIDVNKENPLYWAADKGHTECVKALLAHRSVDVNRRNDFGYPPLYTAADYGHTECVKALLSHPDIDVNIKDDFLYLQTSLHCAIRGNHTECVKALLSHPDIDVNLLDDEGDTPLQVAHRWEYKESVKALLLHPGIVVNKAINKDGTTPLHLAIRYNLPECVEALLKHPDIDVNIKEKSLFGSSTPLHSAIRGNRTECVKALLAHPNIDVNLPDDDGRTPLDYASMLRHSACMQLLLKAGASK